MSWNYRYTVREVDGEEMWEVREIYYVNGEISTYTIDGVAACGQDRAELTADLELMLEAAKHPAYDLDAKSWRDIKKE